MAWLRRALAATGMIGLFGLVWFAYEFYTPPVAPPCRQVAPEHFTHANAAGCLVRRGDTVLMVRRRFHGDLDFPGGLQKWQETSACAAHRETWEETGADVVVGRMIYNVCTGYRMYECTVADDWEPNARHSPDWAEEVGAQWVNFSEISPDEYRYPKVYERMGQVVRGQLGHPVP